ncbi:tRNA pseudouridine(55) synthase TruB [Timonella sp. A28]|uniref:tRNA pseudouridine(55) synthase TruB n=1 Tax=Timonella sp. A28 TaxID=3442640 RepID=UPI003EC0B256
MSEVRKAGPRRPPAEDGLVIVDKPINWTSHDVVARMRTLAATRKVGHAGTLDPMATGVLVVGVGKATRLLNYIVGADKEYQATIRLGVATTTEDAQGDVTQVVETSGVSFDEIVHAAGTLTGDILQVPSAVSAIKVNGKRAYERVRSGEHVELEARPVTVHSFEVHDVREAVSDHGKVVDVDVTVCVSSGTYVRALARDLAVELGTVGHLTRLRRTRVAGYTLENSATLEQLEADVAEHGSISVLKLADAARSAFDVRDLTEEETTALGFGKRLSPQHTSATSDTPVTVAGISPAGELVALLKEDGRKAQPVVVFAVQQ